MLVQGPTLRTTNGTGQQESTHGVLEAGLHFLQKPFTMTIRAEKIREVLNGTIVYR